MKNQNKWKKVIILIILLVISIVGITYVLDNKSSADEFITSSVIQGNISNNVTATGLVQTITTVQVGSQQSGTISWLGADFNSQVKKGQIIARLDPSTLQAQVDNATAALDSALAAKEMAEKAYSQELANIESSKANLTVLRIQSEDAQRIVTRNKEIANIISAREIESSMASAQVAQARYNQGLAQLKQVETSASSAKVKITQTMAQVQQAKTILEQAKINLERTIITSPIDGIVISRNVDVGQTVAASLQAPTLFTIANDLSKMRVLANIDEADVGNIKQNQLVNFTVDAFPKDLFQGTILEVRLNPITTQNVVIYNAVINFDNPGEKLHPGMTANVVIPIEHREDVLLVPNTALRFKPQQEDLPESVQKSKSADQQNTNSDNRRGSRKATAQQSDPTKDTTKDISQKPQATENTESSPALESKQSKAEHAIVWVLNAQNTLERRRIQLGITDGKVTEVVSGNLKVGDKVVTSKSSKSSSTKSSQPQSTSPFSNRPPMGGGRRGA